MLENNNNNKPRRKTCSIRPEDSFVLSKMPKSRRDRTVTLSKTRKKVGLEFKQNLVDKIRKAVDDYARCFVFTIDNMRNSHLKVTCETITSIL